VTPANKKSFWALIVTQFFGAFNDNLLKILVTLLIVELIDEPEQRNALVNLSGAVFVAPFLLFSMAAGRLSDRTGKPGVIFGVQIWQIVVVAVATVSVLSKHLPWMMTSLFLLSMQAAFFSPAKYGILPELMGETELSNGNGILNMATFVAILAGTIAGSFLSTHLAVACAMLIVASVGGLLGSLSIEKLPAAKSEEPWAWNPLSDLWANWKLIRQDRTLKLGLIAVNYFWFLGALLQLNIFLYAKEMMDATPQTSGMLLVSVTVGIALGSFLAGKWSKGGIDLSLVPLGALGMGLFAVDLLWAYGSLPRTLFDLFMLGVNGGFYEVPLNAMIQWRSPAGERARILATQNFISFAAILWASAALWMMGSLLRFNPAEVLFAVGILSLAVLGILAAVSKESRDFFVEALWHRLWRTPSSHR
jgi:acyl-[acyl-carrier-protein]-phospholipid O-acyltransferase/long-chain-fatty-acid--[acyl-carrier-protein] ligase